MAAVDRRSPGSARRTACGGFARRGTGGRLACGRAARCRSTSRRSLTRCAMNRADGRKRTAPQAEQAPQAEHSAAGRIRSRADRVGCDLAAWIARRRRVAIRRRSAGRPGDHRRDAGDDGRGAGGGDARDARAGGRSRRGGCASRSTNRSRADGDRRCDGRTARSSRGFCARRAELRSHDRAVRADRGDRHIDGACRNRGSARRRRNRPLRSPCRKHKSQFRSKTRSKSRSCRSTRHLRPKRTPRAPSRKCRRWNCSPALHGWRRCRFCRPRSARAVIFEARFKPDAAGDFAPAERTEPRRRTAGGS